MQYTTQKSKKNTPERLELKKYNKFLKRMYVHKVIVLCVLHIYLLILNKILILYVASVCLFVCSTLHREIKS
jgi:hypothetical protein